MVFQTIYNMDEEICYYPEEVSCVVVEGEHIPVDNVEFINIEEDVTGKDLMTFKYNGQTKKSYIIKKYI